MKKEQKITGLELYRHFPWYQRVTDSIQGILTQDAIDAVSEYGLDIEDYKKLLFYQTGARELIGETNDRMQKLTQHELWEIYQYQKTELAKWERQEASDWAAQNLKEYKISRLRQALSAKCFQDFDAQLAAISELEATVNLFRFESDLLSPNIHSDWPNELLSKKKRKKK